MNNRTQIIMQEIDHQNNQKIEHVISKEKSRLLNFIRQRTPTLEDAEDILQDVFYELVQSYRLMKPVEQLASWLFTVARNKITDSYRKKKSSSLEDVAHMETIADCLEELPKEQRDAFVMHELEDKSMQQIADEMNVSVKTVISRKRYAVLFLRERLQFIYKQILNN